MSRFTKEQIKFISQEAERANVEIPSDFNKMTDEEKHSIYDMCCIIEEIEAVNNPGSERGETASDIVTEISKTFRK